MTYKDYMNKRKKLEYKAEDQITAGKLTDSKKTMSSITKLDKQFDTQRDAMAELDATRESRPRGSKIPSWFGNGERAKVDSNGYLIDDTTSPSMFLGRNQSMLDMVTDRPSVLNDSDALGDVVRGLVTGKWKSKKLKNEVSTSTTGTIIPQVLSAEVIDMARSLSFFTEAGVPTVPMDTNNYLVSRICEDPVFSFKAEGEEGSEVGIGIDGVKLESKTCYGWAYVTIEAIESSQNLSDILTRTFASSIAQAIDVGMLYGQDDDGNAADFAPQGILNDPDILTVEASNNGYDDLVKAFSLVKQNDYNPTVWGINSFTDESLALLKDNEGRYLEMPTALEGLEKVVSNQLAHDDSAGSDGIVLAPESLLIGIQNDVRIKVIEDEACLKRGLVGFQIYAMLDAKVVSPKGICVVRGLV